MHNTWYIRGTPYALLGGVGPNVFTMELNVSNLSRTPVCSYDLLAIQVAFALLQQVGGSQRMLIGRVWQRGAIPGEQCTGFVYK